MTNIDLSTVDPTRAVSLDYAVKIADQWGEDDVLAAAETFHAFLTGAPKDGPKTSFDAAVGAFFEVRTDLALDGASVLSLHRNGENIHLRVQVNGEAFSVAVLTPSDRDALRAALTPSRLGPDGEPLDFARYRYFVSNIGNHRRVDGEHVVVYKPSEKGWDESTFRLEEMVKDSYFTEVTE